MQNNKFSLQELGRHFDEDWRPQLHRSGAGGESCSAGHKFSYGLRTYVKHGRKREQVYKIVFRSRQGDSEVR